MVSFCMKVSDAEENATTIVYLVSALLSVIGMLNISATIQHSSNDISTRKFNYNNCILFITTSQTTTILSIYIVSFSNRFIGISWNCNQSNSDSILPISLQYSNVYWFSCFCSVLHHLFLFLVWKNSFGGISEYHLTLILGQPSYRFICIGQFGNYRNITHWLFVTMWCHGAFPPFLWLLYWELTK